MSEASVVLQPIVGEFTKPLVHRIAKELDYLLHSKKYVDKLNLLIQPFKAHFKIVKDDVEKASKLGKSIKPEVLLWFEQAEKIIKEAEPLLEGSNERCFHGWCVDFTSRRKINKEAERISKNIDKFRSIPGRTSVDLPPPPPAVLSDPDFMEFESTKQTMQQVIEALKDAECGVVGIFGMGGIGKTTIVKKIAEKVKQDGQFEQVVMAVVSQSPNLKKIQGQIASMLDLNLDERAEVEGRASQLRERLMNVKSILVILDDVWAGLDLTKIGIPGFVKPKGCKVMLTTRSKDVCTSMGTGNGNTIEVGLLSNEESWELFKSNAGDGIETQPDLKEVAMDVMNECQRLPLALKTVGRALRGKDISRWKSAALQLKKSSYTQIDGMSKEVISCLRLSYDYLESDEMKACFLVCCLFPEDFDIPIEILVRYAFGKRLFRDASTIEEARILTQTILGKLKASSLLLERDYYNEGEAVVKVHDVVRDVGLFIASEAKLLFKSGPRLGQWLRNNPTSIKPIRGACFATEDPLPEGIECPELEDLCIVSKNNIDYSDAFFQTMKELKVLIHLGPSRPIHGERLRYPVSRTWFIPSLPIHDRRSPLPTSIKCLVCLRTLHLVGCESGCISTALGELKMLEILVIINTDIESLPVELGQLTNLRLLDLRRNNHLERIPGNVISQLSQLEELCLGDCFDDWKIEGTSSDVEKASLSELQSLPYLAILFIRVREFAQFPPNFSLLNKLVKFEISFGAFDEHLFTYPTSRKLTLGRGEYQVEGWKSLLSLTGGSNDLISLSIYASDWISSMTSFAITNDNVVPVFANLRKLRLEGLPSLKGLASGGVEGTTATATSVGLLPPGSLQHLKVLSIWECDDLEGWAVPRSWTQRLHGLERVYIRSCFNVKGLFEVEELENNILLYNLRVLSLNGLAQLRRFTNGESSSIHFSNLRDVHIRECPSLVSVFTPNVVSQGLVHLETLRIFECPGLKVIFEEDEGVSNSSSSSQESQTRRTPTFPNLKSVYVEKCEQLKTLFTVSMAKGLSKLEELELRGNSGLEDVVCSNQNRAAGAATEENKEINAAQSSSITWPQIRKIKITNSMQLKRFCPRNSCVEMPMLQEFKHINCSDWMKNFAADPPAHGLKIPKSENIIVTMDYPGEE